MRNPLDNPPPYSILRHSGGGHGGRLGKGADVSLATAMPSRKAPHILMQDSDFSLLSAIKANWSKILQALDDLKSNRKSDYSKTKAVVEFYNATKSKGLDFGNLKAKFETSNKHDLTLKKFEKDNSSVKSEDVDKLHAYLKSNQYLNQLNSQTRTAFEKHVKAVAAYNKTLNGLTDTLKEALKKMVDTNNNNATTFQILLVDKMVENLQDFPADKRKNFIAERTRLKQQLSTYNADHTEKSKKLLNEGVFSTIAHQVKRIKEEASGKMHYIEAFKAKVRINHSVIEFRTHRNGIKDPYFHQGADFSGWEHEGILYCPSKFPTKDGAMLEADETFVLDVKGGSADPDNNHLTLVMVNHEKGIIFNTYRHIHEIYVREGDKIKAGDKLGNYWKYKKNPSTSHAKLIGYAKPTNKLNHYTGVSLDYRSPKRNDFPSHSSPPATGGAPVKGDFPIYHFTNGGDLPYFIKKPGNVFYMLETAGTEKIQEKDIANMKLKFRNEHFHIERRFMDKATYVTDQFGKEDTLPLGNINLSQNFTKHYSNHDNLKTVALNSSFGDLIPASALLDTGSAESKFLLKELVDLRGTDPYTKYTEKNYGKVEVGEMTKLIVATTDAVIRDYTALLMFENIVKLACQFQNYSGGKDNCNLSELQRQITEAKTLLETKKFAKPKT